MPDNTLPDAILPRFFIGEAFTLQVGPMTPAVDFSTTPIQMYFEKEGGTTRLVASGADVTVAPDKSYATVYKSPAWTEANFTAGNYTVYVVAGNATTLDVWAMLRMLVIRPAAGPITS